MVNRMEYRLENGYENRGRYLDTLYSDLLERFRQVLKANRVMHMAFDKHMYSCFCFTYAYASACGDHRHKNILMIIEFKPRQSRTSVVGITSDDQTNFI